MRTVPVLLNDKAVFTTCFNWVNNGYEGSLWRSKYVLSYNLTVSFTFSTLLYKDEV